MSCLDDSVLAEMVDGRLSPEDRGRVEVHIDGCGRCRDLVASLAPAMVGHAAGGRLDVGATASALDSLTDVYVRPDAASPMLRAGLEVDQFRIIRHVARGGMGDIYLARDVKLARKVALKVVRAELFDSRDAMARFQHEARAMARLAHPNILAIHSVGEFDGMPYVAMEYIEGETLAQRTAQGRLVPDEVVRIARAVAAALQAAHGRGVIHCDLKPDNVMLGDDGRVTVVDFGLAHVGNTVDSSSFAPTLPHGEGTLATLAAGSGGTPRYMAPEQWEAAGTSAATDVWALGVLFYEMAFAVHPFARSQNVADLGRDICTAAFRSIPAGVAPLDPTIHAAIMRCLDPDPALRPSLDQVLRVLEGTAEVERGPSRAPVAHAASSLARADAPSPAARVRTVAFVVVALAVGIAVGALAIAR